MGDYGSPSLWRGYLKLALVTRPVAITRATTSGEAVRFHNINRETGIRVRSHYVDSATGELAEDEQQLKGYPVGKDGGGARPFFFASIVNGAYYRARVSCT